VTTYPVGVSGVSVAAQCICSEIHHARTLPNAQCSLWSTMCLRVFEERIRWCQEHSVEVQAQSCPIEQSVQGKVKKSVSHVSFSNSVFLSLRFPSLFFQLLLCMCYSPVYMYTVYSAWYLWSILYISLFSCSGRS